MSFIEPHERTFLEAVSRISHANPFLPERIHHERMALGGEFDESLAHWNLLGDDPEFHQINTKKIIEKGFEITTRLRERLKREVKASSDELRLYEEVSLFLLYTYFAQRFKEVFVRSAGNREYDFFEEFVRYWNKFFDFHAYKLPRTKEASHIFACFFQVRRAFYYIYRAIIGRSSVAATLRAAAWTSIFTHDMRRYRRTYFRKMGDFATLITGPTGSGKELVARAIGFSRYIPFDPDTRTFKQDFEETFFPINLPALPATLIESELFGHRRGAFTGALEDRKGWLEICPDEGTIFLDEIGELETQIQVKLLRVIQSRTFQPLGSTKILRFRGKIVTATHKNIHTAMEEGTFRHDLYYRLCSDMITTPSLHRQMVESPEIIRDLVDYISHHVAGKEGDDIAVEVKEWIDKRLGPDYTWPGNIRELEQCVRNIMIRSEYYPVSGAGPVLDESVIKALNAGELTLEEVSQIYCCHVYAKTGSYVEAGRTLDVDRRTVKRMVRK